MSQESIVNTHEPLETASDLEKAGILRRSSAYRLAKRGIIPSYAVGPKQTGVRFRRSEVLAALRRPVWEAVR
jgi:hypothetical protein